MINEKMVEFGENSSAIRELFEYGNKRKKEIGEENVLDFSIGNPNVPSPDSIKESFINILNEVNPTILHGYTSLPGDYGTRQAISQYMNDKYDIGANASNIYMTAGAAASLTISLRAVCHDGNEVIVFTPYFPEYLTYIENARAVMVEVPLEFKTFQPDFDALEKAINPNTAAIIINSPNNPTGAIMTAESLTRIAQILDEAEKRFGTEIFIISDEPYRELTYDNIELPLPIKFYHDTLVCYSYSKSLSMPGERIGYVLISPQANRMDKLIAAVGGSARSMGYICAPSLMQRVVAMNQGVTSDLEAYDKNRQMIYDIVTKYGFDAVRPEGAFYLFVKSPSGDGKEFSERAKKYELLLVPSDSFGIEGYVRISYCVSKEQIEKSEAAFRALAKDYGLI